MIVKLSSADAPLLDDADRFDRLHVETAVPVVSAELGSLVSPADDDDHAWLVIAELAALLIATTQTGTAPEQFSSMIDFARQQGWVSADGLRIRAHVIDV